MKLPSHMSTILLALLLTLHTGSAIAMKPHFADTESYYNNDRTIELKLRLHDSAELIAAPEVSLESNHWSQHTIAYPSEAVIADQAGYVYLLGGKGDASVSLGKVLIYSLEGALLHEIELKQTLPKLESWSRSISRKGNFPWISEVELGAGGHKLYVHLCAKQWVIIDGASGKVSKTSRP